ncbi:FAD-dependent oxidoreductase [Paenibacillus sp. WQ 127069]|uniref:FAD-dependent oxidoreductase n=1 Tax=Paenibacillus baimaensis TaxID=2982185 RepID=A0ABT2URK7_9BACL|nr:FAD-dependent oxidoreductase [Paenibacillus sp. WQ 127069]MCU6796646.1 FAD-dependent oxidoreductase [Paenibacillus sp. WQ 127069]
MKWNAKKLSVALALFALVAVGVFYSWMTFAKEDKTRIESAADISKTPPAAKPQTAAPTPPPEPNIPTEQVDIAIFGSELEGLYLARAAADEGLKVKVLDPREGFGGQVLQGEMLFLDETRDDKYNLMVQGRAKELFDGFRNGKIRKLTEFTQYFDKLKKDIPIESGIKIVDIKQTAGQFGPNAVESVTYAGKDGTKKNIKAAYWVDNSDFAALLSQLKVNRMPGLEQFYGETKIEYMSSGFMLKFKNVDWAKFSSSFNNMTAQERKTKYGGGSVSESYAIGLSGMTSAYKPSNERVFLRGLNAVNQRDGEVLINAFLIYTVDPSDEKSVAEAMELGKNELPLILNHFRKNIIGWEKAELNGSPNYLYIREYNHYETDYVLKPSDMLGANMFWDNVSIAGYPLDLQGISTSKWGIEMGRPDKYGMPLRSFLLKDYDNVLVAGKNVGSSAIAYGSARIQPNTSLAAETIGILLGQIQGKKKLRELKEADMPALHSYLETKYKIKLTGVVGNNKIKGWTADEIAKLDIGKIVYPAYVNTRKK